jgi:hypothetical protein
MRQGRRNTAREVVAAIAAEAEEFERLNVKPNAAEILRKLHDRARRNEFSGASIPHERTIRNILAARATTPADATPWQATAATADDAEMVLPSLAQLIEKTEGKRRHLSIAEAVLIAGIRRAAPGVDPWMAYSLARESIAYPDAGISVDAFLAFAPWTGPEARSRYETATREGWIDPPLVWIREVNNERLARFRSETPEPATLRRRRRGGHDGKTRKR